MDELRQLGRYQLQKVLGRGAMGVVYEGADPKLNRQVAVKLILKSNIEDPAMEAEYSARFIREAQAVARLNHPNIVTVFDFGEENNIAFLVMELIRGDELKNYFDEKKSFALDDAVRMTCELLDALDYAHKHDIVHRDIKPANVMLDEQMRVKLTDFGVARLSDAGNDKTQIGTMVGTPSYMSPEQIEGSGVGPRSDLFAVGIILYQFLTGEKPFHANGLWAIQKKIMHDDPILPSTINSTLSPAFDTVILRALAKKPEDRYPTARAFKDELERVLTGDDLADSDSTRLVLLPRSAPAISVAESAAAAAAAESAESATAAGLEIEFWRSIKDSNDSEEFELYIKRFPSGAYVDLAKRKLAKLRGETTGSLTDSLPLPLANTPDDATMLAPASQISASAATLTKAPPETLAESGKKAQKKWLFPSVAAGVVALVGLIVGIMVANSPPAEKPNKPSDSAPVVATTPVAPAPAAPDLSAQKVLEEKIKRLEDLEKERSEEAKKQALALAQAQAKAQTDKKPVTSNDPNNLAALAKKQADDLAAKKLAEEKAAAQLALKNKQDEAKKTELALLDSRKAEEKRIADEQTRKAEEKRIADEQARKVEEKRIADELARKAEETRKAEEARKVGQAAPSNNLGAGTLFQDARNLETQGKIKEAIRAYKQAVSAGSGDAAKRLGNIYGKGLGEQTRDYAESVKWNNKAREMGMDIPKTEKVE